MTERIPTNQSEVNIPWFLQDHEGPTFREKTKDKLSSSYKELVERRKRTSKAIARMVIDKMFDHSGIVDIADYDEDNPDKYEQDVAFASYEPNLREEYYREKSTRAKELGNMATVVTGMDLALSKWENKKGARQRNKERRQGYIARNGTLKSQMRNRYISRMNRQ